MFLIARVYYLTGFGLLLLTKLCFSIYTVQPVSLNATLNSTATFTCEATRSTAFLIYFYVGTISANEDSIVKRGFTQESQYTLNETLQRSLSVWAQETNNNTSISCGSAPGDVRSTIAVLKIQGFLASVGDLTDKSTFINGSSVLLSWTPPYTLDNVPITGYYIVDGSENYTTSDTSFVVSSTEPDPCTLVNVSVSAINAVGIGNPAYISFYYEKVPLVTPIVSVMLLLNEGIIYVSMKINKLCIGEYPNNITFCVLETNGSVVYSNSISPQINEQMMIMTGHSPLMLPDIPTVIINVSLSNKGGEFNDVSSFRFVNGPVTNIRSVIYNCTNITISWDSPNDNYIAYYRLEIYDYNNDQLVHSAMVHGTSYQFEVDRLIYKFIITGVNEIGKGMSKSSVISFQKIPRSAEAVCTILNHTNDYVHFLVDILGTMDCILEAPDYIIIHVLCKEIGIVFSRIYQAEYNATEFVFSVPQYKAECNLSIVLSNDAGLSDPLRIPLVTTSPATTYSIQLPTIISTSTNSTTSIVITAVIGSVCTVIMLVIVCFSVLVIINIHMKRRNKTTNIVSIPNPAYDDIAKFKANISINPAYGQVKTETRQNVIYDEIIA